MQERVLFGSAFLIWILSSVVVAQEISSNNPCVAETFYHAKMEREEVYSEFEGADFRIRTGRSADDDPVTVGTAYLIDNKNGYALTAFHVVQPADSDHGISIYGTSSRLPSDLLEFKLLGHLDEPIDAAILQLTESSRPLVSHIRSLDIAFHFLPKGSRYFTIGYPRGKLAPNDQEAELQGRDDNRLDVKQDVDEGTSGSPLIDENGAAVGIATGMLNKSEALYTPMAYVEDLFRSIPGDSSIFGDLDVKVLKKPAHAVRLGLIQQFKWTSGNPSNLELYEWARHVSENQGRYKSSGFYFRCPILAAYNDRRLGDSEFIQRLAGLFSAELHAKMLLNSADQDVLLGKPDVAAKLALQSYEIYKNLNNRKGVANALSAMGRANLRPGTYEEAVEAFQQGLALEPDQEYQASVKWQLGKANIGLADYPGASQNLYAALNEYKAIGDVGAQGNVYTTLGELANHEGRYPQAIAYFKEGSKLCANASDQFCVNASNTELAHIQNAHSPLYSIGKQELNSTGKLRLTLLYLVAVTISAYIIAYCVIWAKRLLVTDRSEDKR